MIINSCEDERVNSFSFTQDYWECSKKGGTVSIFSNKDEWKIDQLKVDGIIIKEYSPEYLNDKNQKFPPNEFELSFFSFKIEHKKVTISLKENLSNNKRTVSFWCRHVNTFNTITVVQQP